MESNLALRQSRTERERQEKFRRHARQKESRMVGKTEAAIKRWLTDQDTPGGTALTQSRQAILDE